LRSRKDASQRLNKAHRRLRNHDGPLFLVELEPDQPQRIEAVPLKLEYAYTRLGGRVDPAATQAHVLRTGDAVLDEGRQASRRRQDRGPGIDQATPLSICPIVRWQQRSQKFYNSEDEQWR
jgi:hypothetical protein